MPTNLHFVRDSYGPFSPEISLLITRLVNNGLIQEVQQGERFTLKLGPTYRDATHVFRTELAQWEAIIDRIADLFLRMEMQEAEIAATAHFTAQALEHEDGSAVTEKAIFDGVKQWKQRRRPPLQDDAIAQTIRDLNVLGWLHAQPSPDLPLLEDEALLDV